MEFKIEELEHIVTEQLSEKRAAHTMRCAICAKKLAARFGASEEDAYLAGLLHDITKELSVENQLKLCQKHGIILDNVSKENPALLHAITASYIAKHDFSASDSICQAILYHTTAHVNMTILDQCVWLADMIEPGRDFPGVSEIRKKAEQDLSLAVLSGIDYTIMHLISQEKMIHPAMLEARNEILHKRKSLKRGFKP